MMWRIRDRADRRASIPARLALFSLLMVAGGCSASGDTTCAEYGELPGSERSQRVRELIQDQGLDWTSNLVAVAEIELEINEYCGTSGLGALLGADAPATRNLGHAVGDAIDWDHYAEK